MTVTLPRIGTFLSLGSPDAAAIVSSRLDLVLIDAEHGVDDEPTLLAQMRAARCPYRWIRVRQLADAPKALDLGADGVVIPRIRAASEVAELVKICLYPPDGTRGLGPSPANLYGMLMRDQLAHGTRSGELWPQIETLEAVGALSEILALDPGPTGLFIGPGDLSAALGHPGELTHPKVSETVEWIATQCTAAGCSFAIFCPDRSDAQRWTELGASTIVVGSEAGWMVEGAARVWAFRDALARQ